MKKIYISSSLKNIEDFFTISLKHDLSEIGYDILNKESSESFIDENKISPEYWISRADFFIAIIKDRTPNVFYELGYATALGKKVLIISESEYDLPLSLKKYSHLRLDSIISNSFYSIINFLEKSTSTDSQSQEEINDLRQLVVSIRRNPQIIDRISGPQLEDIVYQYFRSIGAAIQVPNAPTDYGYDFMLLDWNSHRKTIVEVKKYNKNSKVSVNTIQQVIGAMNIYDADYGIIICTSEFTASAKEFAKSVQKPIELWDIDYLTSHLI